MGGEAGRDRLDGVRLRFFARRLAMLLASLLVASFVIFGAIYLAPGNPIGAITGALIGTVFIFSGVELSPQEIAARKAQDAADELKLAAPMTRGSVVASDAFFPFADGLLVAIEAGATAVIQPGGSVRDDEVIKAADDHGIAMVFTGVRHFRH